MNTLNLARYFLNQVPIDVGSKSGSKSNSTKVRFVSHAAILQEFLDQNNEIEVQYNDPHHRCNVQGLFN